MSKAGDDPVGDLKWERAQKAKAAALAARTNNTHPVFDFDSVTVNTVINNQSDLTRLMDRLAKIKALLPADPPSEGTEQ